MKYTIKLLIERIKLIKTLLKCDEYFLAVANSKNNIEPWRGPIIYEYFTNSDRELFWAFVHDHIENTKRSITGNFICIRTYSDDQKDVYVMKGDVVKFNNGYITAVSNGSTFQYRIPNEEIYSHFKLISK
jgi:hypothetical protein